MQKDNNKKKHEIFVSIFNGFAWWDHVEICWKLQGSILLMVQTESIVRTKVKLYLNYKDQRQTPLYLLLTFSYSPVVIVFVKVTFGLKFW